MARIRTVKPDYWGDPKTARLSLPARLLFIGLLTEADDEGRFLASGKKLAGSLFQNDDDVTPKKVLGWLCELETVGFVRRYTVEEVEYAHIPAFNDHQRISHPTPSRLPNPSGTSPETFRPDLEQGTGNREMEQGSELTLVVIDPKPTVREVFDLWRSETGHDRAILDSKREARIKWALENYPPDDIADAIRGAAASPFHQGQNPRGKRFDDLDLIFRDAKHLEDFRDEYRTGRVTPIPKAWGALSRIAQEQT
jgi:hypothetical protein